MSWCHAGYKLVEDGLCVNRVRLGLGREEHVDLALKDKIRIQGLMKIQSLITRRLPGR